MRRTTADREGLPKELLPGMNALIDNTLEPLCEVYGKSVKVNSGYVVLLFIRGRMRLKDKPAHERETADIVGTPNTKEEDKTVSPDSRA